MAASVTYSVWAENNLAFVNFSWQADSGGLCNSLGIISSITGRVFGIRLVTLQCGFRICSSFRIFRQAYDRRGLFIPTISTVAVDKASLDLADKLSDGKFSQINKVDKNRQIEIAAKMRLGKMEYELIRT